MSATGLGSAAGGASGTATALCADVEEDAEFCGDNDKEDNDREDDEEMDDDENDDEEDFESLANTAAATNNNKDRGSRTKRPPSILTSNARPGSIQFSVPEMPDEHVFREHCGML